MQTIWKNCGILFGKIVAFYLEKLWYFTWKNCGISLGRIEASSILFDIHKTASL